MNSARPTLPGWQTCLTRRGFLRRLAAGLAGWAGGGLGTAAVAAEYSVQQVQSVLLFNFAQFVKWPAAAFPDAVTPLTIGVLGPNPFSGELEKAIRGESVGGRGMSVKYASRADELKKCQIVFICQSEASRLTSVLEIFRNSPILTVSAIPRFCDQGGMINFFIESGRVKFAINPRPAKSAGLQISTKLLRLAY